MVGGRSGLGGLPTTLGVDEAAPRGDLPFTARRLLGEAICGSMIHCRYFGCIYNHGIEGCNTYCYKWSFIFHTSLQAL